MADFSGFNRRVIQRLSLDLGNNKDRRSQLSLFILISCVYFACIVVFFYPYFNNFTSVLIGPPEDNMQDFWNTWYSQVAFDSNNVDLFRTNLLFYPEGVSLVYHSFAYPSLLLIYILRKMLFLPLTVSTLVGMHNLMLVVSYYLSAIGCFYLAKHYTRDNLSSLIGGFIFGFSPFHFAYTLHSMSVSTIQYIPFFVLCFIRFIEAGKWKAFTGTVIFYLLSALSCWYYLFYIAYFILFYYLFNAIQKRTFIIKELIKSILMIFVSVFLFLSPFIIPMVLEGMNNPKVYSWGHNIFVADLLAFVVFHPYHLFSNLTANINSHFTGNAWGKTVYLGVVNIGLMAWWLIKKQKDYPIQGLSYNLWGMIIFMLFSGGSYLHIAGLTAPLPLPTHFTQSMPFFQNIRTPSRAIIFSYLFLSVIVAMITSKYMSLISRRRGIIFFAMVAALVFIDFYPTGRDHTKVDCPKAYEIITNDTDSKNFGILDLPGGHKEGNRYMMYQVAHGKPIVNASIARKLSLTFTDTVDMIHLKIQKKQLIDNSVKYIIIHDDLYETSVHSVSIDEYMAEYPVVYSDNNYIVMKVY
jgi:hypothetical protein